MIFLVHQCDMKACKENRVIDGNFDNNMECCTAKEGGYIEFDSLPGEIRTGCQFCEEHLRDHKELDKVGIK